LKRKHLGGEHAAGHGRVLLGQLARGSDRRGADHGEGECCGIAMQCSTREDQGTLREQTL